MTTTDIATDKRDQRQDDDQAAAPAAAPDGAELLDQIRAAVARYVQLPSADAMHAVVVWIAATHAVPAWNAAPRLVIRAPEKRCGKSRLLDLVEALCHRPIVTANASPAAVYRCIGESPNDPPTLLIDEADTIFGPRAGDANEDLRGLLNAGHQRNRPALRWNAARNELDHIPTFGMAALAGIGAMPDTIEDRAVVIVMRRRAPDEEVQPYRARRDGPALHQLRDQLHAWATDQLPELRDAAPILPVEDRAADTWEPLIAVADAAGGHWPTTARAACLALTATGETVESVSLRVRLLMDCRTAFGDAAGLPSSTLLDRLRADDEAPWTSYGRDGLTARGLSAMLRDFDISSANRRWPDGGQSKGYLRDDFTDAWSRYCPPERPGHLSVPSVPPSQPPETGTDTHPWDGTSVPPPSPWDGKAVPNSPIRPTSTPVGRRDGWDGKGTPTARTVCITCREPMTYDDGTHTHPTCTTA